MDATPGTTMRMEGEEVPAFLSLKMSPHQIGVPDMLFAAKLKDLYPQNVVLLGVQPENLGVGLDLSAKVAAAVPELVAQACAILQSWGHTLQRREK